MRSSQTAPKDARQKFWYVVRPCIREFHPNRSTSALSKATRLRKKVESMPARDREFFLPCRAI